MFYTFKTKKNTLYKNMLIKFIQFFLSGILYIKIKQIKIEHIMH